MAEVFLRRLSRWQADQQREAVADVFVEAYGMHGKEFRERQVFLEAFAKDVQRTGFDMVVAGAGGTNAGNAYGYLVDRAGDWWRDVGSDVPWNIEELTVSGQVFAVAELMVVPSFRRMGVAGRLIAQLLERASAALAVARLDPSDEAALAAFRSWGWVRLGSVSESDTTLPSIGTGTATDVWCRALRT